MTFRNLDFSVKFLTEQEASGYLDLTNPDLEQETREKQKLAQERSHKIQRFIQMTDIPYAKSEQLLENSHWDFDKAIQGYFLS